MTISAMVLGKDRDYDEYCLKSLEGIVDEVIRSGTKKDDFAALRNECIKKSKGDWILVLDSDEVLALPDGSPVKREHLEELIRIADERGLHGYHIFTLHFMYNYRFIDGRHNGSHFSYGRFFRKRELLGYKGKIHELPVFKMGQNLASINEIWIWHFGHCKGVENMRRKYKRTMHIAGNPFKPLFEKYKDIDDYCAHHEIFNMTLPLINYVGPLPKVMRLW